MKKVLYTTGANNALRKYRAEAGKITAKVARYAETGAGKVTELVGVPGFRLRVGDYRVIFEEDATTITVLHIGHRRDVYD